MCSTKLRLEAAFREGFLAAALRKGTDQRSHGCYRWPKARIHRGGQPPYSSRPEDRRTAVGDQGDGCRGWRLAAASGCVGKASCASRETSRSKSKKLPGR